MTQGKYSKEFKLEAVKLLNQGEIPATKLAMKLGVKRTLLYRWRDEYKEQGETAFTKKRGRKKLEDRSELEQLRKKLADVTEERDILKKAAAYFAKELR